MVKTIKVLGIQPGTVVDGMTNEQYVDKQIALMEEAVKKEQPYLVAFPEMMTGIYFGFVREKRWFQYAEDFLTGSTTTKMVQKSKELNVHIAYSVFEKSIENGHEVYYNTMGLVSPVRGVIGRYRKIHVPGGDLRYTPVYEKYYFNSGDKLPVFELDNGVKVSMLICFDRSFPEVWRTYYLKGAQIVIAATCTMGLRKDMFVAELQTRALESHTYVMGLNRAGVEKTENETEPRIHFGKSIIIDPLGDIITSLEAEEWSYVTAELDMEKQEYARGRLNWQRDRHPELYGAVSDPYYAVDGLIYEKGF